MNKRLTKQIIYAVIAELGADYETADIHPDDIDNAVHAIAQELGLDEDDIRFAANLPR